MYIKNKPYTPENKNVTYNKFSIYEKMLIGGKEKEIPLLRLGSKFNLPKEKWRTLTNRIQVILNHGPALFLPDKEIEDLAQELAPKIREKLAEYGEESKIEQINKTSLTPANLQGIVHTNNLSVGVANIALHAMDQLNFFEIFKKLEFSDKEANMAMCLVAARMEKPASEKATFKFLEEYSFLGEMVGIDFTQSSVMSLHRLADKIIEHKDEFETFLSERQHNLFTNSSSVLLYDLTNSHFEGIPDSSKAHRGHSKQNKTKCLLESLALVVDNQKQIVKSIFFPGNVSEPTTLEEVLDTLKPPIGATMVMDKGIATENNVKLMISRGYNYFVANRRSNREFDHNHPEITGYKTKSNKMIYLYHTDETLEIDKDKVVKERWLHCYSPDRESKEIGINTGKKEKFEKGLADLDKRAQTSRKPLPKSEAMLKIGRLNERHKVSHHYDVTVDSMPSDREDGDRLVTGVSFVFNPVVKTKMTDPGAYIIRTSLLHLTDDKIWTGYTKLTDIESVFESLKSELGFRPVYHYKERRIDAHFFISILAYQCVNFIRNKLKNHGIHDSWKSIVNDMKMHKIVTTLVPTNKGKQIIQNVLRPNRHQVRIYEALGLSHIPRHMKDK
jgi:transposase